jgi:hypothetical protein
VAAIGPASSLAAIATAPPRVAVVMPFLNAERFIDESIQSVLAQNLGDWELLLVDDGSTDRSAAIAGTYAARFPQRIRILRHPGHANRGIAASRNLGVSQTLAPYVAFLDADDVYEPARLEQHLQELDRDPGVAAVISAECYWYSWAGDGAGAQAQPDRIIASVVQPGRRYEPPALIAASLLTRGAHMPATCGVTVRSQVYRALGGIPEEFRGHYEDQVFFCKLLLEYPAWVSGRVLARYRQHPGSITGGNSSLCSGPGSAAMAARERFLHWLEQYLRDAGHDLPEFLGWIESELYRVRAASRITGHGLQPARKRWLAAIRRVLPVWLVRSGYAGAHVLGDFFARRRAMRLIRRYEGAHVAKP